MMIFLAIAWRNVIRNGRRTALTVSICALGLATLIISNAQYAGFHEKMVNTAVRIFMGHLQIHTTGFHGNPTVEKCYEPLPDNVLAGVPHLSAFARRVRFQALASTASNSLGVLVAGVDPEPEARVTLLARSVVEGKYFDSEPDGVKTCLVGEQLYRNLRLMRGEKLVLMAQAYDGSMAADVFRVVGVCRSGNPDIDRSFVWITLPAAQSFLVYGSKISETVLLLKNSDYVDKAQSFLKMRAGSPAREILTWKEIAPDIVQLIQLELAMQRILMLIITVIVTMAIMNTMLMAIQERFTEFGVLAAIGTAPEEVVGMVMLESLILGALGVVAGLVLTGLALIYFCTHGVNLASFAAGMAKFIGMDTVVYPLLKPGEVISSCLMILISATFISLVPALKAARMNPVAAIRHI